MNSEIEKYLLDNQDIKYKNFQEKLGLSNRNLIGVRIPLLRKYAKSLLKDNYLDYLDNPSDKYFESILLEGFLIAYSKMPLKDKFKYMDKYILKIDNWATCDSFCTSFKIKKEELDLYFNYLEKYKNSNKEYVLRFIIVMMLNHFLIDEYIDRVLLVIKDIKSDKYYVEMALGWLLSFIYIKYQDKFEMFICNNDLSSNVIKYTYKKIKESNRVKNIKI